MWDKRGEYWKEQFGIFTPVKLADGREVWSVGDVVIHNVQNGRTTIVTATRAVITRATLQACSALPRYKASCVAARSSNGRRPSVDCVLSMACDLPSAFMRFSFTFSRG